MQERTIIEITNKICELMQKEGVSDEELAKRLVISKRQLRNILDGRKDITLRMLSDILYCLGYYVRWQFAALGEIFWVQQNMKWLTVELRRRL